MELKEQRRLRRKKRVRGKISGTESKPRLTVFRSNQHIYAQLIDDESGKTIVSASDFAVKSGTGVEKATAIGKEIAKLATAKKITAVVFDRNGYQYHGQIKAVADGAREGGLIF